MKESSVRGKVAVITGASGGLGESTARLLASRGAKVVLGARRSDRLERLARAIVDEGGTAVAVTTDVTRREDVEALVRTAVERFERLDVLVNNAGLASYAPLELLKVEEWDKMIDVNVKGVLYGVSAALPYMRRQKMGHIVNVASVVGLKVAAPNGAVYSATKFAVRALTEGLRVEVHAQNIRTTMISPGAIATDILDGTSDPTSADAIKRAYAAAALPVDAVANAVLYAIEQPPDVEIDEIVLRPTAEDF